MKTCETCGVSFEPKIQTSGRFCSVECFWTRGPDGPRKASVKGQRMRMVRDHPLAPPSGVVGIGRLVLYDKIGAGPHVCHWCGKTIDWTRGIRSNSVVVDHLDWNQSNDSPENLVPSCGSCNSRRAAPGRRSAIGADEPSLPTNGGKHRTRAIEVVCEGCGEPFLTVPSRPKRFCSKGGRGRCANQPKGPAIP